MQVTHPGAPEDPSYVRLASSCLILDLLHFTLEEKLLWVVTLSKIAQITQQNVKSLILANQILKVVF